MLDKGLRIGIAAVLLLSAVPAVAGAALPDVVAVVNGEKITRDQLTATLIDWQSPMVLDEMITCRIVAQEARKAGVVVTVDQVKARMEETKKNLPPGQDFEAMLRRNGLTLGHAFSMFKMQLQAEGVLRKSIEVTPEGLASYRRASHILIMVRPVPMGPGEEAEDPEAKANEARAKMESIAEEVKGGLTFEEAAEKYSEDPQTKSKGGDLGFFVKEQMGPEFGEAVFGMKIGEISEPVRSPYGYHLIKLTGLGETTAGEERKALEEKIIQREVRTKYRGWMLDVKSKAKVDNKIEPVKPKPTVERRPTPRPVPSRTPPPPAPSETPPAPPPPPSAPAAAVEAPSE